MEVEDVTSMFNFWFGLATNGLVSSSAARRPTILCFKPPLRFWVYRVTTTETPNSHKEQRAKVVCTHLVSIPNLPEFYRQWNNHDLDFEEHEEQVIWAVHTWNIYQLRLMRFNEVQKKHYKKENIKEQSMNISGFTVDQRSRGTVVLLYLSVSVFPHDTPPNKILTKNICNKI